MLGIVVIVCGWIDWVFGPSYEYIQAGSEAMIELLVK